MHNNNKIKGIWDNLNRLFNLNTLITITTIVSVLVSVYVYYDNTSSDKLIKKELSELKDSISNNALTIKMTFKNDGITTRLLPDSTRNDILEFEESTRALVHVWEEHTTLPSFATLKPDSLNEAYNIIQHYTKIETKLNEAQQAVLSDIQKVLSNGKNERKMDLVSTSSKLFAFQNQYIEWMDIFYKQQEKVLQNIRKIKANKDTKADEFMEALKPYDEIKKDIRFYKCMNMLFSYCIELEQVYNYTYKLH